MSNTTGLRQALTTAGALTGQFCERLNLSRLYGRLVLCGVRVSALVFWSATPDPDTYEMLGVRTGTGDPAEGRTADLMINDYEGVYRSVLGGNAAYQGARTVLDPAKLFFTGVTTASSPDPTVSIRMDFNDGSTWGFDFGVSYTNGIASGVTVNQSGIPVGSTLGMFAGDASKITVFHCNSNQLTGEIPNLAANTAQLEFYCHSNQLTGGIPDLSFNTALRVFYCNDNQLTGEIPDLSANTELLTFYCNDNQLTGEIPDLSANTDLKNFYCHSNQLTGGIPDLSFNTALRIFYCKGNQLTGEIPDLSANTELLTFYGNNNQLTAAAVGWAWPIEQEINFNLSNNALTASTVNAILIAADTALSTGAGTTINLSGGTNAAPTGAGITAKDSLITKGASVTTN